MYLFQLRYVLQYVKIVPYSTVTLTVLFIVYCFTYRYRLFVLFWLLNMIIGYTAKINYIYISYFQKRSGFTN